MKHQIIAGSCKFIILLNTLFTQDAVRFICFSSAFCFRYFGGWVAPNIYYLGASNVIVLKKGSTQIRLGGISGICYPLDFVNSQLEKFPFNKTSVISCYHQK